MTIMPSWSEVLTEIQLTQNHIHIAQNKSPLDIVRRKYLKALFTKENRNVIAYYSGWLQKPNNDKAFINDDDKNGFMAAIHKMDRSKGLDLILHTPGGQLAVTESLVDYLRKMFGNNIRAFIPQLAMSAGTMIACSCKEIYMGKQSSLGPVDPQFNGIAAYSVKAEFQKAIQGIKDDPASLPIWQAIIGRYHPTFIIECDNVINLASNMMREWLKTGMFAGESNSDTAINHIINKLNNHDDTKTHSRHIPINELLDMGLKIIPLEQDQDLQDIVLTIHHAYMHTLAQSASVKIIENHLENAVITFAKI